MKKIPAVVFLLLFPLILCADDAANLTPAVNLTPAAIAPAAILTPSVILTPVKEANAAADNNFKEAVLLGSDVVLSAVAVLACMDYSGSLTAYEKLYASLNETDMSNYDILVYDKKQVEQKGTYMAVLTSIAGLAVLYTLSDLFYFHNVFEAPVRLSVN